MTDYELRAIRALTRELIALRREINAVQQQRVAAETQAHHQPSGPIQAEIQTDPITQAAVREYYEAENRKRNSWFERFRPWVETSGVGIAGVLALFTLLTMCEIRKQTPEIKKSADAAKSAAQTASHSLGFSRDSFRQDQRPYIALPGQFSGGGVGVHESRLRVMMQIQNYGKSPAIEGRYFAHIAIGDRQIAHLDFTRDATEEIGIIAPGIQPPIAIYSDPLDVALQAQKPEIIAATNPIIIYGRIEYTDMFPSPKPKYALFFCMGGCANRYRQRQGPKAVQQKQLHTIAASLSRRPQSYQIVVSQVICCPCNALGDSAA